MATFAGDLDDFKGIECFDLLSCHNHSLIKHTILCQVCAKSMIWAVSPPAYSFLMKPVDTHPVDTRKGGHTSMQCMYNDDLFSNGDEKSRNID